MPTHSVCVVTVLLLLLLVIIVVDDNDYDHFFSTMINMQVLSFFQMQRNNSSVTPLQ